MDTKPWYESKTLWLNLATLVSLALVLPEVGEVIPAAWTKYIAAGNAVLNLALRVFGATAQPLSFRKVE